MILAVWSEYGSYALPAEKTERGQGENNEVSVYQVPPRMRLDHRTAFAAFG
jgi:hypothetical protein